MIAQSDVGIELRHSATGVAGSFSKLVNVISVPDTGTAREKLESTELNQESKSYIPGRKDLPDMEFGYNMLASNYEAVDAVCDTPHYFLIVYGEGNGVLIYGTGSTWATAVSRNQVVEAKLNIVAESCDYKTVAEVSALSSGS